MRPKTVGERKRSIFRTIFIPVIAIMIVQSMILYLVAVYGGIEKSLNQNAVDILSEQLTNRTNYIETKFNTEWTDLEAYENEIANSYKNYKTKTKTDKPLVDNVDNQVEFLKETGDILVETIRETKVNGVFLMLNDSATKEKFKGGSQQKVYGVHIRDMDPSSTYSNREDLLLERAPTAAVDTLGCTLDSGWEAYYTFESESNGSYYYKPLNAAYDNVGASSDDLAYFSGTHTLNTNDREVISYSIPLVDENGYPFGILGIEITDKYITSLLPSSELGDANVGCYILGTYDDDKKVYSSGIESGAFYNRCFNNDAKIDGSNKEATGGFSLSARGNKIYGLSRTLEIYNNNNPFEKDHPVIIALIDKHNLFAYSSRIKITLLWVTILSLVLGVIGLYVVSRRFSMPITALADKAKHMKPEKEIVLGHLGIKEIDQLVDSIEDLSENVSKEVARTEFFSRMSHDMRTPMNAIISFSSNELLEDSDEATKTDYLSKINSSGQYLLGLINEVLDMTKIESNKVDIKEEPKIAFEVWNSVIPMVDELAITKGVVFEKKIICADDLCLLIDVQHTSQILMNLLSNAVKFTPAKGRVSLSVNVIDTDEYNVNCKIVVADSGIGMSEEFQKRLYTPFEQEHSDKGGTGLGLSICKQLTELMGGDIACRSKLNEGTTFEVNLPFAKGNLSEVPRDEGISPKDEVAIEEILKGKRILLCEDHPLNMQIAIKLLEKKGVMVEAATNGKEGVDIFEKSENGYFDAVLMDIRMPVMDGLEAASEIRTLDRSDAKSTPIVAMTANAFAEDEEASQKAGMNAHLSKPINPKLLYKTLAELL